MSIVWRSLFIKKAVEIPSLSHGLVGGIFYFADKPAAVVDRKIVHEGSMIDGVAVVKIYQDKVEFAKNRKKWMQKVKEKPASYW
jgi:hypothetical protein